MKELLASIMADIRTAFTVESDRPLTLKHILAGLLWSRSVQTMLCYRLAHLAYKRSIPLLPHLLRRVPAVLYGADISFEAELGPGVFLHHLTGIVVGHGVQSKGQLNIFQGVTLGKGTTEWWEDFPKLAENVTIHAGAKVLGGINLGEGAIVAANAVVLHNVPAQATVAGVPARVIKLNGQPIATGEAILNARITRLEQEVEQLKTEIAWLRACNTSNKTLPEKAQ